MNVWSAIIWDKGHRVQCISDISLQNRSIQFTDHVYPSNATNAIKHPSKDQCLSAAEGLNCAATVKQWQCFEQKAARRSTLPTAWNSSLRSSSYYPFRIFFEDLSNCFSKCEDPAVWKVEVEKSKIRLDMIHGKTSTKKDTWKTYYWKVLWEENGAHCVINVCKLCRCKHCKHKKICMDTCVLQILKGATKSNSVPLGDLHKAKFEMFLVLNWSQTRTQSMFKKNTKNAVMSFCCETEKWRNTDLKQTVDAHKASWKAVSLM